LVAIDSPDAYLSAAQSAADRNQRWHEILGAYRKLDELKAGRQVAGVGIAAKDWRVVREIESAVDLDWVMLIGSFTVMRHPPELLDFMASLAARQIPMISAGIFHGDFLLGGSSFDSRPVSPEDPADRSLFAWRKSFVALCHAHGISPAHACIQFALAAPGVAAVAINTSHPDRIAENANYSIVKVPEAFWASMKEEGLLAGGL
jgi:D-threo-aldose 1-dehydrogenase